MNNNKDTMAQPAIGVRAYAYRANNQERVALHLPKGAEALDLTVDQMKRFVQSLGELLDELPS